MTQTAEEPAISGGFDIAEKWTLFELGLRT